MIRRTLLLVAAVLVVLASPAGAQEYDGTSGSATVTDEAIIVQAEGFLPNAEITYTVDYTPEGDENAAASLEAAGVLFAKAPAAPTEIVETGTTTSDAQGDVEFQIENRGPGFYEITITDGTNTEVVGVTVAGDGESPAATPTETDDLALTGSDSSIGLAQVAVVLVVLGAVAVYVARRRRAAIFSD